MCHAMKVCKSHVKCETYTYNSIILYKNTKYDITIELFITMQFNKHSNIASIIFNFLFEENRGYL